MTMPLAIRDVMLLHHELDWCESVSAHLAAEGIATRFCDTRGCVDRCLRSGAFDVALVDFDTFGPRLALEVIERLAHAAPAPAIVAWARRIRPEHAFELGRLGVRKLLQARPRPAKAFEIVSDALAAPLNIEPNLRTLVGHVELIPLMSEVRRVVHTQALGLMRDNQAHAAELLGVTRQAVQQMVRRYAPVDVRATGTRARRARGF